MHKRDVCCCQQRWTGRDMKALEPESPAVVKWSTDLASSLLRFGLSWSDLSLLCSYSFLQGWEHTVCAAGLCNLGFSLLVCFRKGHSYQSA